MPSMTALGGGATGRNFDRTVVEGSLCLAAHESALSEQLAHRMVCHFVFFNHWEDQRGSPRAGKRASRSGRYRPGIGPAVTVKHRQGPEINRLRT